jgi:hypothetical protein
MWSSLKVYLKHYRKYVAGLDNEELYDVDRLLEDLQNVTRPKEIIALMREKDENSLAQSLHFMTDDNRLAQRMLIVVGNALFTTHSTRATNKLTPADNRRWRYWEVRNWQAELVTMVSDTLFDPRRLMYMGVTLRFVGQSDADLEEEVEHQQRIVSRIFDQLKHMLGLRVWQLLLRGRAPPSVFAGLLEDSDGCRSDRLKLLEKQWRVLLDGELRATHSKDWQTFMDVIYWRRWPVTRIPFMLLDREGFEFKGEAASWISDMEESFGDSKLIEEFNHHVHHQATHESSGGLNKAASLYSKMRNCGVLESRCGQFAAPIKITEQDFEEPPPLSKAWDHSNFKARAMQLPQDWSKVMLKPGKAWRSPAHAGARSALTAWEWMQYHALHDWSQEVRPSPFAAWQSALVECFWIMCSWEPNCAVFVVGVAAYGLAVWELDITPAG